MSELLAATSGTPREVETPEGVPLTLRLADRSDRAVAFALDAAIWMVALIALAFLTTLGSTTGDLDAGWSTPFVLVAAFLLRNFYYTWFELRWRGRTPGKRALKLRVIDRAGGPLTAEAVIARNLMREIEVFLPLSLLLAPEVLWPTIPGWARLLAALWAFVLLFMPLFNRDRLRVGDLVGGTMVVVEPKLVLLPDLGLPAGPGTERLAFSAEQLAIYGVYELQVLERVLRQEPGLARDGALPAVADRIKRKIRWDPAQWSVDDERFLTDFYAALRRHLEHGMMFGKRRRDKHARD